MAIFRPGASVAEVRGSVGGTVFSRNRGGSYMRTRVAPIQPNTTRQGTIRNAMALLQNVFAGTLTANQRSQWTSFAENNTRPNRLGEQIRLSAINMFIRINSIRKAAGVSTLTVPPTGSCETGGPTITVAATTAAGLTITAISPALSAGDILVFQCSGPLSNVVNFFKGPWAYCNYYKSTDTTPLTVVAIGAFVIGNRFKYRYRYQSATGQMSPFQYGQVDVAA